ncbi:MAG: aminotransferase class V-fold PLP-dependent enzyme [Anaerolineae bacterium]|nr:aminotransferase class V-fold PLP-dependent enzyme [Anaerolineae bacterium]
MSSSATYETAYADFLSSYPAYATTAKLDELRNTEYARLDRDSHVYLDYTGGGIYADSQLDAHFDLLRHNTFGNPHSHNPTSMAMTELVEETRATVLRYFNAPAADYCVIFTPNASGALKLVGESYPFAQGGHFAISADDHNSVNGIREFARAKGAHVTYLPVRAPDLRLDRAEVERTLAHNDPAYPSLFAYPAQSNYSGVKHPLDLIETAHSYGWDVCLDSAAFAPTSRLDIGRWQPDFVTLSFYKMFGYPTGVGALIARKVALAKLQRPWFAGGTIKIASVLAERHYFADDEAAFEDGTVNYLTIPAVGIGLRHLEAIGMDTISTRVRCLTGWLIDALTSLRHRSGVPLAHVHGPNSLADRGGTITISFFDQAGRPISGHRIEVMAADELISLRTGCFCNPGAGEATFALSRDVMIDSFARADGMHFVELVHMIQTEQGIDISAVRISVGLVTTFADVYKFMQFVRGFLDRDSAEFDHVQRDHRIDATRDAS